MTVHVIDLTTRTARTPTVHLSQQRGTLIGELNLEWARLRLAAASSQTVAEWSEHVPMLRGLGSVPEVEERHGRISDADRDALLLELLQLGHAGDALAHRFVMQLMLGKAVRVARSQRSISDPEEAIAEAVSALWETVRTYPTERRATKVAANLAMDTLSLLHRRRRTRLLEIVGLPEFEVVAPPSDATVPAEVELRRLLDWAVTRCVVSPEDARLLVLTHTAGPNGQPPRSSEVGELVGLTAAAVRKRSQRAITKVAAAVAHGHAVTQEHADESTRGHSHR